ncbi:MAG: lectin-like protein [Sandaracinaceae bacterium]
MPRRHAALIALALSGCTAIRPLDQPSDAGAVDARVEPDAGAPDAGDPCAEITLGAPCDGPDADECTEGTWSCASGTPTCSDTSDDTLEACGGGDEDCDGSVDENMPVGVGMWSPDVDGDGFGDPSTVVVSCDPVSDYVDDQSDCDDSNDRVFPTASDVCNGIDDDCNGAVDDGVPCASFCTRHVGLGSTYQLCTRDRPIVQARDQCVAFGYHLAKIEDVAEQDFLATRVMAAGDRAWIGLVSATGAYRWLDGSTPTYTAWAPGEPSSSSLGNAAVIRATDGLWDAVPQTQVSAYYICEVP